MGQQTLNKPGTLVTYRSRDWMVLPSADPDLLCIKPLGGSDEEETAIYLPLQIPGEDVKQASFPNPNLTDLGNFSTARMLFDAARLSFRNASGPFRCMGKLSFRPRAYQLVPLVMALKQETTRLLIADDVGIGKTIEALIILKELMERGDVKRFAVLCPPHLCEQWAQELKDKLDIDAEIIRSSTAARLDRTLPDDRSVFHHVPYQVISIDYVKSDKRRGIFISDCPELLIVDEVHTCALPEGATSKNQQQRHALLHDLAKKQERHLVMLTATPHSGKDSEFQSIIGMLKPEFGQFDLEHTSQTQKRKLATHFIQRKRENIRKWLEEETTFPEREAREQGYNLTLEYQAFYADMLQLARGISEQRTEKKQAKLLRSWAAIALIRGTMSSPAMAYEMLHNRKAKLLDEDFADSIPQDKNLFFDSMEYADDTPRSELLGALDLQKTEREEIERLQEEAKRLCHTTFDNKLGQAIKLVQAWLKEGFQPIIFCKYIPTANYVAKHLRQALPPKVHVEAVTSELADEQRRERIAEMGHAEKRVLVATDCLSEGINLQDSFTAVLHYDLPWNPNRLEQREGRVDRYGQTAPVVKAYLLYGVDNAMDEFVRDVLIRKVRDIHKSTGVTISIGEDTENLMSMAAEKILMQGQVGEAKQMRMFVEETIEQELQRARQKGENLRSIFAHESIKPEAIRTDLQEVDEAIGDVTTVEQFVVQALTHLGASCIRKGEGYELQTTNLPHHLKAHFSLKKGNPLISFESPTPKGYRYIGRNHLFVEQLCHFILALAFDPPLPSNRVARVAEVATDSVAIRTTLVMFRVRNVIKEVSSRREIISEEMYLWGYRGFDSSIETLDYTEAKELLLTARSLHTLPTQRITADLERELTRFGTLEPRFREVASERADKLVEAHSRFKDLVGGRRYEKATPVLPPDVMGIYILVPKPDDL